ncbi:hypothetical protein [Tistrella mobilis]|uniref:Uncharacterized protein n=1 Tax=Tistrella mobilis (strain KA081020-065) TaxID=1110502 RepID=I3TL83_TISMK|nr:hypothetical protein [Tistrella mobilis]AFK53521.1 hypothetical protein TMO_1682 [Tistrella mobilis KA081020-065]
MDPLIIKTIFLGTLRDPILWILCAVLGWQTDRPLHKLLWMLVAGGLFFGLFRGLVYRYGFDEALTGDTFGMVIASATLLTIAGGMAVFGLRSAWQARGKARDTALQDTGRKGESRPGGSRKGGTRPVQTDAPRRRRNDDRARKRRS